MYTAFTQALHEFMKIDWGKVQKFKSGKSDEEKSDEEIGKLIRGKVKKEIKKILQGPEPKEKRIWSKLTNEGISNCGYFSILDANIISYIILLTGSLEALLKISQTNKFFLRLSLEERHWKPQITSLFWYFGLDCNNLALPTTPGSLKIYYGRFKRIRKLHNYLTNFNKHSISQKREVRKLLEEMQLIEVLQVIKGLY